MSNINKRWPILIIILLLFLIGLFAWRSLRVLNIQTRAGQLIDEYTQNNADEFANYFTCQIPLIKTQQEDRNLERAIFLLEKAQRIQPQNAHTHLLLGRAFCLNSDFSNAVTALGTYNQKRPGNTLGILEAGYAHFALSLTSNEADQKTIHENISREIFTNIGFTWQGCINEGNAVFQRGVYPAAWLWYRLAAIFDPLPEEIAMRTALLDLIFTGETDLEGYHQDIPQYVLYDALTITPDAFFQFVGGMPLEMTTLDDRPVVIFSNETQPAGVLLNILEDDHFCISASINVPSPFPKIIEISLDIEPLIYMELEQVDGTWLTIDTSVYMEEGFHLLGFSLIDDETIDNRENIGYIEIVTIQTCQE